MTFESPTRLPRHPRRGARWLPLVALLAAAGCAPAMTSSGAAGGDPRVGLGAGLMDAQEASWNLRVLSETPPPRDFIGVTNSDLAFRGNLAIQGNYNGYQVWDISNPAKPSLVEGFVCPASQSDVSVYGDLLFVSGEGLSGRLDCGTQGVETAVSPARLRGIRIFDISDIHNPKNVGNVQTCRGSHTHTLLVDPKDRENVYIYVSGSSSVRPAAELAGCVSAPPSEDPNSALFRIEVIRVPLAHPEQAAIVSSPRIFDQLVEPPRHGASPADRAALERAKAQGAITYMRNGTESVLPTQFAQVLLDSIVKARGGTGAPTAADTATLRREATAIIERRYPTGQEANGPRPGPTQCHDITVYPAIGLAGGACEGYGLLLDIRDPVNPRRLTAVSDSNFSYWHSATFNNEGSKMIFTDEWGGGGQPKCRVGDPREWGADAIFTRTGSELHFQSYYKLPAVQTEQENCVAHNGSLIPIPGRDVMVQAWYQGGISVFDFTDAAHPKEIAFFDRGPVNAQRMEMGGSWSAYWYNGVIVSSEIARGLDIFQLTPSEFLTQNEIDAARSVKLDYLNPQGQPKFEWPASYALARAYMDQAERAGTLPEERIAALRAELAASERDAVDARDVLIRLAGELGDGAGQVTQPGSLAYVVAGMGGR